MQIQNTISEVTTDLEIEQCWEVISLLRPHLNKNNWKEIIHEMMENEKYRISGIMENNQCVAFAGYRIMNSLHSGHIIYIDDLCTLESHRGRGLGSQLLEYIEKMARTNAMDAVVLDTDFTNNTAQKVYLKSGFQLAALHLAHPLKK